MKGRGRLLVAFSLVAASCTPRSAYAIFGEEDWLSGQNALLTEMLAKQIEEVTKISVLIANVKMIVRSTNEAFALARTVKRVYDMIRTYSLQDWVRDAKQGLYKALPDAKKLEGEIVSLVENKKALE